MEVEIQILKAPLSLKQSNEEDNSSIVNFHDGFGIPDKSLALLCIHSSLI